MDAAGNVNGYDDYYPFGLTMPGRSSNSSNPDDEYKFTGHEPDREGGTDLYYMGARNYDPEMEFNYISFSRFNQYVYKAIHDLQ